MKEPHRLLRVLESLVRKDPGAPRVDRGGSPGAAELSGVVVVGVKGGGEFSLWHAAFEAGSLLGTGALDGMPPDADAIVVFEDRQASALLEGKEPEGEVSTFGDHDLLDAFIDRYCTFRSFVDVRSSS